MGRRLVMCAVAWVVAGVGVAGGARADGWREEFSSGLDGSRFVEAFSGFSVAGGVLRGDAKPGERPFLDLLPMFGKRSAIDFDLRWTGGARGSVMVFANWRYRPNGPFAGVYVLPDRNWVGWIGTSTGATVRFAKGKWAHVRVVRSEADVTVAIDGAPILTRAIEHKPPTVYETAEEEGYGSFALGLEREQVAQHVEFDNLVVEGERAPVQFKAYTQPFTIRDVEHVFSVLHEAGFEAWARAQTSVSIPYIQFVSEQFGGVLPMSRRLGMVQAHGQYFASGFAYNNFGMVVNQAFADQPNSLSCHELGHNWFHLFAKRWNTEASADLACSLWWNRVPGALMTADKMAVEDAVKDDVRREPRSLAFALDDDSIMTFTGMPTHKLAQGAWKSRVFWLMLYRILGPERFGELHRRAARLGHGMSSAETKQLAEAIMGSRLDALFNGWVFPGTGLVSVEQTLVDTDGDGLSDLDEKLFRTSPASVDTDGDGYGDRGEIAAGYDPTKASEPPPGTLLVDGLPGDWKGVPVLATDKEEGKGDADMIALRAVVDATNQTLFLRVDYARPFNKDDKTTEETYLSLDFAQPGSRSIDHRVNLFPGPRTAGAFRTTGAWTLGVGMNPSKWTGLPADAVQVARGEVDGHGFAEAAIPLELVGGAGPLDMYVYSGSPAGTDWFEVAPARTPPTAKLQKRPARPFAPVWRSLSASSWGFLR